MKRTINAVVQIEYHTDDDSWFADHCTEEENDIQALDLVMQQSNFHTILNGVQLKSVQADIVNPDKLIDWDKLKHNPDFVVLNPEEKTQEMKIMIIEDSAGVYNGIIESTQLINDYIDGLNIVEDAETIEFLRNDESSALEFIKNMWGINYKIIK